MRRFRQAKLQVAGLAAITVLAAACSSAPGNAGAQATSSQAAALAFSQCMRSHGIQNFPNPGSNGVVDLTPQEANVNSPQFQSAMKSCRSLEKGVSLVQNAGGQADLLKFAKCMRSHGISDFPDPSANGGTTITGTGDLNSHSPQYQRAQQACYKYLSAALSKEKGGS